MDRIWAATEIRSTVGKEERRLEEEEGIEVWKLGEARGRGTSSLASDDAISDYERHGEDGDVDTAKEDWDWRIGYAS